MERFLEIKTGKNKPKYIIFRISDDQSQIIFEEEVYANERSCQECWEELCRKLVDEVPRYILYDVHLETEDKRKVTKLVLVSW